MSRKEAPSLFPDVDDRPSDMIRAALISPDGLYRYTLERRWGEGDFVNFVMLNPSTADASLDDPTIRRCIGFARGWSYGGLVVTNLFALRATDPKALYAHRCPEGPDNDATLAEVAGRSGLIVCAWGAHGPRVVFGHVRGVLDLLRESGKPLHCLGTTKAGQPLHPLYLRADLKPVPFPTREARP